MIDNSLLETAPDSNLNEYLGTEESSYSNLTELESNLSKSGKEYSFVKKLENSRKDSKQNER